MSNKLEQMLEHIVNGDEQKARELFHEVVVEKSRDIYESLIDEQDLEEISDNVVDDFEDDIEADQEGFSMDDAEEELGGELDVDVDSDESDEVEDRLDDIEAEMDNLQAAFDKLVGDDEVDAEEDDMDDMDVDLDVDVADEDDVEDDEVEESVDVEDVEDDELDEEIEQLVREYTEKAPAPKGDESNGKAGPVAGKNTKVDANGANSDNLNQGGKEAGASKPAVKDMGVKGKHGQETGGKLKSAPKANT
jgi:hypothetical protein